MKIHLTGHQRETLQRLHLIKVKDGKMLQANSLDCLDSLNVPNAVNSWIFTPSFGRFSGQRQAFLDWSQAMSGCLWYAPQKSRSTCSLSKALGRLQTLFLAQ